MKDNTMTMIARMEYDLALTHQEGAIREKLIEMGWTPPGAKPAQPVEAVDVVKLEALAKKFDERCRCHLLANPCGQYADSFGQAADLLRVLIKEATLAHPRPSYPEIPDGSMVEVVAEDANNYCRILTVLGMEEEGNPVAEVERLVAVAESTSTGEQAGYATCDRCGATSDKDAETRCIPDGDSCPGCEEPLHSAWQAGQVVAFRVVGLRGPYPWFDGRPDPKLILGKSERLELAYAQPRLAGEQAGEMVGVVGGLSPDLVRDLVAHYPGLADRVAEHLAQPTPVGVPDGYSPTDDEVRAWCERHDLADSHIEEWRVAIDDARSMHLLADAPAPRKGGEA